MDNQKFLQVIKASFKKFLITGSRSNEKLKILHGAIANDIIEKLNDETYSVNSLGIGRGQESTIRGRYIDKKVDITITKNEDVVAGIGVKFVMQNYSQNSNNYFENMLGETANIRSRSIPYFQIFIIPDVLPYYDTYGNIKNWESFTEHNVIKYITLSKDDIETSIHTPTKTLLFVVHLPEPDTEIYNKQDYIKYYSTLTPLEIYTTNINYGKFESSVIFNNYENFINKLICYLKFIE
ncbi:MAG: hypothetical protein IJ213_01895 [Bacteroidales bacterium]|nr:hypothetical protein [Bacteroidales bacterium]MBQ9311777.1 hypothetical protein [Bacteroidales bacterium]